MAADVLRGLMVTADGGMRVHQVSLDGQPRIRIEARGRGNRQDGSWGAVWHHIADVTHPQEVARHLDVSELRATGT